MRHAGAESIRYGAARGMAGIETLSARSLRRGFERHFHDTYAFGVVLEGVERCTTGRRLHFFEPGHVPLFNPGDVHDGGPAAPQGWSYRMVYVERALVAPRFGEAVFPGAVRADGAARGRVLALFDALDCGTVLGIDSTLHLALRELLDSASDSFRGLAPATLGRVRERIEAQCCTPLTLRELCAEAGVSEAALLRAFERAYGLTPHRYQHSCRVARARRLIAAGMGLAEVAAACGYADQSHLNRWFLRIHGVTPGNFRRNIVQDARTANRPG